MREEDIEAGAQSFSRYSKKKLKKSIWGFVAEIGEHNRGVRLAPEQRKSSFRGWRKEAREDLSAAKQELNRRRKRKHRRR